jgi:ABC-type nitrate/sulfonate/bicarbonate transport system permease component
MENSNGSMIGLGIVGSLIGGFVAFLARPSAFLFGQLPFETVISRGANLEMLDILLVPLAQKSFNITLIGMIIGAVVGIIIGYFFGKKKTAQTGS